MLANETFKTVSPPEISEIIEQLKREDIYIGQDLPNVKKPCQHTLEENAIRSVNKALEDLLRLHTVFEDALAGRSLDIMLAVRILEQIQIASADVDRCAFACHLRRANQSSVSAQKIAVMARHVFRELKEINSRRSRKKAA